MKKNKRFWLATALVVLLILLFVDFNTYESTQQEQLTKMSLTESEFEANFQKSENVVKGEIIIKNQEVPINDSSIIEKVIINYKYSDNISIGIGKYIPLYKNISFSNEVFYKWTATNSAGKTKTHYGKMKYDGTTLVKGVCSTKTAEKNIKKTISNSIEKEIKKEVNKIMEVKGTNNSTSVKISIN